MAQRLPVALSILRRKQVERDSGYSRSTIYLRIAQGSVAAASQPWTAGRGLAGWRGCGHKRGTHRGQVRQRHPRLGDQAARGA